MSRTNIALTVVALVIVVAIVTAGFNGFDIIPYQPHVLDAGKGLVTALVVVTAFVERATAVLASIWFNESIANARIAKDDAATIKVTEKQTQARQIMALIIGVLVSLAGTRTLEALLDLTKAKQPIPSFQLGLFYAVDILITAGLIAGGSDGIHKISEILTSLSDKTIKKARAA
jgi:hypothetical protein